MIHQLPQEEWETLFLQHLLKPPYETSEEEYPIFNLKILTNVGYIIPELGKDSEKTTIDVVHNTGRMEEGEDNKLQTLESHFLKESTDVGKILIGFKKTINPMRIIVEDGIRYLKLIKIEFDEYQKIGDLYQPYPRFK